MYVAPVVLDTTAAAGLLKHIHPNSTIPEGVGDRLKKVGCSCGT